MDIDGNQLNPNVPENARSLGPISVATYSAMDTGIHYRTIEYVVGFLADAGVELESTGSVITVEDFPPDLQAYVNWAFDHPNDLTAALGLMLASGPGMEIPDSAPIMTGSFTISPLCSLMLMGDILIGIEAEEQEPAAKKGSWFADTAYADTSRDAASRASMGLLPKSRH